MSPRLGLAAEVGALAFLVCLLVLHALTLRSLPWYMSEYANSPFRGIFIAGGYAFALALACMAVGLSRSLPHTRRILLGLVLLAGVAPFAFLATTFRVDPGGKGTTWEGQVHDWSTVPMFLFLNAALLLLAPSLRRGEDARLARFTWIAGLVAGGAELAYLASRLADIPTVAVAQRLVVATAILWCVLAAHALRKGFAVVVATPNPQDTALAAPPGGALPAPEPGVATSGPRQG